MRIIDDIASLSGCDKDVVRKELLSVTLSIVMSIFCILIILLLTFKIPQFKPLSILLPIFIIIPFISISRSKCLLEYFRINSALGREELYASIAIIVLSLLGSWDYIVRALRNSFPATARVLKCKVNVGSKLLKEVKDIVENIVFRDGTLPHVARERIMHTVRSSVEDYGNLVQVLITGLAMLYMFFIVVAFMSFMSSMFNPSSFVFMVVFLTLMFSLIITSKSPVHDYAIAELRDKAKLIIPIVLIAFIISILVTNDIAISCEIALIAFFISVLIFLRNSCKIDKIDNGVVWDRVINLRLIKGVPVDQALVNVLGRSLYQVYVKTYPFNAIRNLLMHLEDIGGLGIVRMFREMLVEIFNSLQRVIKNVRVNVLMLAGFALAMIGMQIWFANLMLPALKMMKGLHISSGTIGSIYGGMPIQISPSMIIGSLNTTATYVPPIITLAIFLIIRGCSSTTQAARSTLGIAIILLITQLVVKYLIIPHLVSMYLI